MSFKDYIDECKKVLDEHDADTQRLDEYIVKKKRVDGSSGVPVVKTVYVDTDPNYKVVHKKDGTLYRKRITAAERARLQRRKGPKGTRNRSKQKRSLEAHYKRIGGPERNNNGQGSGDTVFKRLLNQKVKSDEVAAKKRKADQLKKNNMDGPTVVNNLTGGPKQIWNG